MQARDREEAPLLALLLLAAWGVLRFVAEELRETLRRADRASDRAVARASRDLGCVSNEDIDRMEAGRGLDGI